MYPSFSYLSHFFFQRYLSVSGLRGHHRHEQMSPDAFPWLKSQENVVLLTDMPQEAVWSQFVTSRALAHVNKTLKQTSMLFL